MSISPAGAGILDGGAVAVGHLTVFQNQHDRDGLAGLADRGEALGHRLADVENAVVTGALFDGALVVEVEAGAAGGTNKIYDFHKKKRSLSLFQINIFNDF